MSKDHPADTTLRDLIERVDRLEKEVHDARIRNWRRRNIAQPHPDPDGKSVVIVGDHTPAPTILDAYDEVVKARSKEMAAETEDRILYREGDDTPAEYTHTDGCIMPIDHKVQGYPLCSDQEAAAILGDDTPALTCPKCGGPAALNPRNDALACFTPGCFYDGPVPRMMQGIWPAKPGEATVAMDADDPVWNAPGDDTPAEPCICGGREIPDPECPVHGVSSGLWPPPVVGDDTPTPLPPPTAIQWETVAAVWKRRALAAEAEVRALTAELERRPKPGRLHRYADDMRAERDALTARLAAAHIIIDALVEICSRATADPTPPPPEGDDGR